MRIKNSSRRQFLRVVGAGAVGLSLQPLLRAKSRFHSLAGELFVYVGTYTAGANNHGQGIYVCRLDLSTGQLRRVAVAEGVVNPSFLAVDRQRQFLCAVNEVNTFAGKDSGAVSSFRIDQRSGALQFLNQQPSAGAGPCHLTVDGSGKFVLVANYDGGSVAVLPWRQGTLGAPVDMVQHHGSSVNPDRQKEPHAHSVVLDRNNRFVFVSDLGLDKILVYAFDSLSGKLSKIGDRAAAIKPGAGPRHFVFHGNGRWAYVINELDSTVTAFSYSSGPGLLTEIQTITTLPAGFSGSSFCAEIAVAPNGKFLYGSNRGHDSIVVFAIDQANGKLALVEHKPTGGKWPRSFTIDPTGEFLLAANQNSGTVVVFRIERASGKLLPTGHVTEIPSPVCLVVAT
jgi:6-phosphogluconolactonase